jgi:hypothetical protein
MDDSGQQESPTHTQPVPGYTPSRHAYHRVAHLLNSFVSILSGEFHPDIGSIVADFPIEQKGRIYTQRPKTLFYWMSRHPSSYRRKLALPASGLMSLRPVPFHNRLVSIGS